MRKLHEGKRLILHLVKVGTIIGDFDERIVVVVVNLNS